MSQITCKWIYKLNRLNKNSITTLRTIYGVGPKTMTGILTLISEKEFSGTNIITLNKEIKSRSLKYNKYNNKNIRYNAVIKWFYN